MQATHPNSAYAAKTHDRNKARTDRRLICEYIAKMGPAGASDEDLERAFVATGMIVGNSLRLRRGELQLRLRDDGYVGYGFITSSLGEMGTSANGKPVTKFHVTQRGIKALGWPADSWCVVLGEGES